MLNAAAFTRVFRSGRRAKDEFFQVIAGAENDDIQARARLGLAVSKRNAPRAVDRNRIKRIVREYFRQNYSGFDKRDYVVVANPAAHRHCNRELRASLAKLFGRLNADQ